MAVLFRAVHSAPQQPSAKRRAGLGVVMGLVICVVSACTTGNVFTLEPAVDVGTTTAAVPDFAPPTAPEPVVTAASISPAPATPIVPAPIAAQPVPNNTPVVMVGYPHINNPVTPSIEPRSEAILSEEIDCRKELKRLRVTYTDVAPIHGSGQCGIAHPVKVSAIGNIEMKPAATLTCAMAVSFASWTRDELVPAARWRYFSGVKTIHQGSSYSCRKIAGERTLSEHGKGNALDVMSIDLSNGKEIDVRKPGLFAFRTRGFLNTVRADGCQYFTTVLGPGYNYDHRNHFHFDIKSRRNGYRACR
jgi:hypothetical protein